MVSMGALITHVFSVDFLHCMHDTILNLNETGGAGKPAMKSNVDR